MPAYIVLHVMDDETKEGWMPNYSPQVASIQESACREDAAVFNVGNHPDAEKRGRPYRVVVIDERDFHEYEVYSESTKGKQAFVAYPSEHPTMRRNV